MGETLPADAIEGEVKQVATKGEVISEALIAARSGVGKKKTEVILHLLREARLIGRSRRGYVLKHMEIPADELLAVLLQVYVERSQHDHGRLDEMMHYAETVDCRVQVIRQYFGEEHGERCRRCDNCKALEGGDAGEDHVARVVADARAQFHDRSVALAASADAHRADEAHDGGGVTRVETMHGTIVTTSPETLPHKAEEPMFAKGDTVQHAQFGKGLVREVVGDLAVVRFSKGGEKKLKVSFLTR